MFLVIICSDPLHLLGSWVPDSFLSSCCQCPCLHILVFLPLSSTLLFSDVSPLMLAAIGHVIAYLPDPDVDGLPAFRIASMLLLVFILLFFAASCSC